MMKRAWRLRMRKRTRAGGRRGGLSRKIPKLPRPIVRSSFNHAVLKGYQVLGIIAKDFKASSIGSLIQPNLNWSSLQEWVRFKQELAAFQRVRIVGWTCVFTLTDPVMMSQVHTAGSPAQPIDWERVWARMSVISTNKLEFTGANNINQNDWITNPGVKTAPPRRAIINKVVLPRNMMWGKFGEKDAIFQYSSAPPPNRNLVTCIWRQANGAVADETAAQWTIQQLSNNLPLNYAALIHDMPNYQGMLDYLESNPNNTNRQVNFSCSVIMKFYLHVQGQSLIY